MRLILMSVYDDVAQFYSPPFAVKTEAEGRRIFDDACKDSRSNIASHPEDYRLFKVGIFDDGSGLVVDSDPVFVARGVAVSPA